MPSGVACLRWTSRNRHLCPTIEPYRLVRCLGRRTVTDIISCAGHCCLACPMASSSTDDIHGPLLDEAVDCSQKPRWLSRTRPMIDHARQFVADNLGLLLVMSSQLFFSTMNVLVKRIHDIDDPISTFEVSAREKNQFLFLALILGFLGN